jgi:hypothetical protein
LQSKSESLAREEKAILADRARLMIEQNQHVKEVKLKRDFDASIYKDQRIMADRYVLMSMFGKGGFAEVRTAAYTMSILVVLLLVYVCCYCSNTTDRYVLMYMFGKGGFAEVRTA